MIQLKLKPLRAPYAQLPRPPHALVGLLDTYAQTRSDDLRAKVLDTIETTLRKVGWPESAMHAFSSNVGMAHATGDRRFSALERLTASGWVHDTRDTVGLLVGKGNLGAGT